MARPPWPSMGEHPAGGLGTSPAPNQEETQKSSLRLVYVAWKKAAYFGQLYMQKRGERLG